MAKSESRSATLVSWIIGAAIIATALLGLATFAVYRVADVERERIRGAKLAVGKSVFYDLWRFDKANGRLPHVREGCKECDGDHSWRIALLQATEVMRGGSRSDWCRPLSSRYSINGRVLEADAALIVGKDSVFGVEEAAGRLADVPERIVIAIVVDRAGADLDSADVVMGDNGERTLDDRGLSEFLAQQEIAVVFGNGDLWILRQGTPLEVVLPLLSRTGAQNPNAKGMLESFAIRRFAGPSPASPQSASK